MRLLTLSCAVMLAAISQPAGAIHLNQLSPDARRLLSDVAERIALQAHDGTVHVGELLRETEDAFHLQLQTRGISSTRIVEKRDVARRQDYDVTPIFRDRLGAFVLDPESSLEPRVYRLAIRLMLEFLKLAEPSPEHVEIRSRCLAFMREFWQLQQGLEKLGGKWHTPVSATIYRFDKIGDELSEVEKDRNFQRDDDKRAQHAELLNQRREMARRLPRLTRERLDLLVGQGNLHGAASEVTDFLHFWMLRVAGSETGESYGIRDMDFGFMLELQQRIIDAWITDPAHVAKPAGLDVPEGMAYVPGGFFLMGDPAAEPGTPTFPAHLVWVDAFLIDVHAASNADYREFVTAVAKSRETWMQHPDAPPLKDHTPASWNEPTLAGDRQPVAGIDWFDAYAYAVWRGKRLPTEAEWELAARSYDGRVYPWGNSIQGATVNYVGGRAFLESEMARQNPPVVLPPTGGCGCFRSRRQRPPPSPVRIPETTWPVDVHLPDVALKAIADDYFAWDKTYLSQFALYHLAGNVNEWTADWYAEDYYGQSPYLNPGGPETGAQRVYRGGHFGSTADDLKGWARGEMRPDRRRRKAFILAPPRHVGVRTVKSVDIGQAHRAAPSAEAMSFDALRRQLSPALGLDEAP